MFTKLSEKIISEMSARASDKDFKDFDLDDYRTAYWRAARTLANKYQIFEKVYSFVLSDIANDITGDIELNINDFRSETLVIVNSIELLKVEKHLKSIYQYCYYIEQINNKILFNYILDIPGYPDITIDSEQLFSGNIFKKSLNDEIVIFYNCLPEKEEFFDSEYMLNQYEEELLRLALTNLAELGMIKYANTEKENKYGLLYKLNSAVPKNNETYKKNKAFPIFRPFTFLNN